MNIVNSSKPSRYRSHRGIKLTKVIFPGQNSSRCLALLTGITLKPLVRIAFEGTRPQLRGPRFRRQELLSELFLDITDAVQRTDLFDRNIFQS